MRVVIRAMSKIHQNVLPRTKDATVVEEKDTSKRNVEMECQGITDQRNRAAFEEFSPTPMR